VAYIDAYEVGPAAAETRSQYRASHDDYEDSYLPSGMRAGSAEEALDCACGLYLNDPSAWVFDTPTN
jgi:hypothetical protein